MMCSGAIEQSRLKKIIYGVKNEKFGYSKNLKKIKIISQICEEECKKIVQCFFQKKKISAFFLIIKSV